MIPKECKRLAEVDFPIAVVSAHSAREKSIRHGHPSTLHLWWARRPLAACRAMLLALLLPDPCDENCPEDFKTRARSLLRNVQGETGAKDLDLRRGLLKFIGDFSNWDLASNPSYLEAGRGLVKAAHGEEAPLVVDPFAGGGSIPLELRLGCEAFASDLNPVACLILRVMLEDIPRHGPKLADELRRVGAEIKKQAEKELGQYYPPDPDGAIPIAYLWARTVKCESPNCGAEIPLMRSFWLCKKASRLRALRAKVLKPKDKTPQIELEIFTPKSEKEVAAGTVTRAKATCLACERVLAPDRVRAQLRQERGGADAIFDPKGNRIAGARLLAVVTLKDGKVGRQYRVPTDRDYEAALKAQKAVEKLANQKLPNGLSVLPYETLPLMSGTFNVPLYGMTRWCDVFTARQKIGMVALINGVANLKYGNAREIASKDLMALASSRCADYNSSLTRWVEVGEFVGSTFGRQALPIVWNFCETALLGDESGGYPGAVAWIAWVVERLTAAGLRAGQVSLADARESQLPDDTCQVWFTDPPYYFAVPYADLSDYFFVWLKRGLHGHAFSKDPFDPENTLTPKDRELCEMSHWDTQRYRNKDKAFFEKGIADTFAEGRRVLQEMGIGCVVFAHKTTEGWEALLSGIVNGGWTVTGSWPVHTEMGARLRARESAAVPAQNSIWCEILGCGE